MILPMKVNRSLLSTLEVDWAQLWGVLQPGDCLNFLLRVFSFFD